MIDPFLNEFLFGGHPNTRWDIKKNAELLNIVYLPGTFGNFLKYFVEKFSTKTPVMEKDPFSNDNNAHALRLKEYSGMVQRYHPSFIVDNEGTRDLPICIIVPSMDPKHSLYLKRAQLFKYAKFNARPDDLWKKPLGEMPDVIKEYTSSILKLYEIKETSHFSWIPKFIVRDWYKLEFLYDIKDTYQYNQFKLFKEHPFFEHHRTYKLDLEAFFDWEVFIESITEMNDMFDLSLDFEMQSEMKNLWEKGKKVDKSRQECIIAEDVLNGKDHNLKDLEVSTEAFIYAMLEKRHPTIQMPLTNRFFRDTDEIKQYIEHFPNWYCRKNPNIG